MLLILVIFFILWLVVTLKNVLFWVYLWQLKEYHIKRFIDHFRTAKGGELLLNKIRIIKVFLLALFLFNPLALFVFLPLIYLAESGKAMLNFYKKNLLKPAFTAKTIAVISMVVTLEILLVLAAFNEIQNKVWLSVLYFPPLLAIADLLTPLIVFWAVLAFKPLTYFFVKTKLSKTKKRIKEFKDLKVIGIAGSYGKTSTKEFLYTILSEKFNVLKTKKNINAEIGIANTILEELNSSHQIFIAEIGAYEKGKIKEVCQSINPDIGILTGISEQHMATFGSQQNIIEAKNEIIKNSKEGIKKENLNLKTENIKEEKEYIYFKINEIDFKINVLGKHNIDNLLLAIATAQKLGMSLPEISNACSKIKVNNLIKRNGKTIIDSSYSANPTGVVADLEYLKLYSEKKAVIMPCLIELESSFDQVHQRIGKKLAQTADIIIITSKECFEIIKKECPGAIYSESLSEIKEKTKEVNIILLEGRIPKEIKKLWV